MDRTQDRAVAVFDGIDGPGDTEVGDFDAPCFGDQNIMGLDIAVDDAVGMGIFQSFANIEGNLYRRVDRQMAVLLYIIYQRFAAHEFHDDVMDVTVAAYIVNTHNIWMGQLPCRLGFMAEPHDKIIVFCKAAVQNFDCHNPVKKDIFGFVHISHTA